MQGKIKWFSSEKGYGFITPNNGDDHYFNVQGVKGSELPSNGDFVKFESKKGNKGPKAFNIEVTEKGILSNTAKTDDRVNCPSCQKKIVPRMITYQGEPQKTVCPFCAKIVRDFRFSWFDLIIGFIVKHPKISIAIGAICLLFLVVSG